MRRFLIVFLLILLILFTLPSDCGGALTGLATDLFRSTARDARVRAVFDLDEEEAVAVFGISEKGTYL